jgi:hypothetical protein
VQEVFCVETPRTLESLRPDPDEVLGLLAVPLPEALALVRGTPRVNALEIRRGETSARAVSLERGDLLPDPDGYFALAIGGVARRLAGAATAPWLLGGAEGAEARRDQTR